MKLILSPIASNRTTTLSVNGDVLTYDGFDYDLSAIQEGQQVEAEEPAIGVIKKVNGQLEIAVQYHYDSSKAEPMQSMDWADYTFEVESGEVPCPIKWKTFQPEVQYNPETETFTLIGCTAFNHYETFNMEISDSDVLRTYTQTGTKEQILENYILFSGKTPEDASGYLDSLIPEPEPEYTPEEGVILLNEEQPNV